MVRLFRSTGRLWPPRYACVRAPHLDGRLRACITNGHLEEAGVLDGVAQSGGDIGILGVRSHQCMCTYIYYC